MADISGFTALSNELSVANQSIGVDQLQKIINRYFAVMVEKVGEFGGDVIKFAGDALICYVSFGPLKVSFFFLRGISCYPIIISVCLRMHSLVHAHNSTNLPHYLLQWDCDGMDNEEKGRVACNTVHCAIKMLEAILSKNITNAEEEMNMIKAVGQVNSKLTLHIGIGVGDTVHLRVGGYRSKYEYLIFGPSLKLAGDALKNSVKNETVVVYDAWMFICKAFNGSPKVEGKFYRIENAISEPDMTDDVRTIALNSLKTHPNISAIALAMESFLPKAVVKFYKGKAMLENISQIRRVTTIFIQLGDTDFDAVPRLDASLPSSPDHAGGGHMGFIKPTLKKGGTMNQSAYLNRQNTNHQSMNKSISSDEANKIMKKSLSLHTSMMHDSHDEDEKVSNIAPPTPKETQARLSVGVTEEKPPSHITSRGARNSIRTLGSYYTNDGQEKRVSSWGSFVNGGAGGVKGGRRGTQTKSTMGEGFAVVEESGMEDEEEDSSFGPSLQQTFLCLQSIISHKGAMVRQLLVDDKGLIVVVVIGIMQHSYSNNAERAIALSMESLSALKPNGFDCSIGISTGEVFTGYVGSVLRREYAVVGNKVNLSARLMGLCGSDDLPDILCDGETYNEVSKAYKFREYPPAKLKGIASPIPVYSPIAKLVDSDYSITAKSMVGRDDVKNQFLNFLKKLDPPKMNNIITISGDSGSGRTLFMDMINNSLLQEFNKTKHVANFSLAKCEDDNPPALALFHDLISTILQMNASFYSLLNDPMKKKHHLSLRLKQIIPEADIIAFLQKVESIINEAVSANKMMKTNWKALSIINENKPSSKISSQSDPMGTGAGSGKGDSSPQSKTRRSQSVGATDETAKSVAVFAKGGAGNKVAPAPAPSDPVIKVVAPSSKVAPAPDGPSPIVLRGSLRSSIRNSISNPGDSPVRESRSHSSVMDSKGHTRSLTVDGMNRIANYNLRVASAEGETKGTIQGVLSSTKTTDELLPFVHAICSDEYRGITQEGFMDNNSSVNNLNPLMVSMPVEVRIAVITELILLILKSHTPLVVYIDDAHNIDEISLTVLNKMIDMKMEGLLVVQTWNTAKTPSFAHKEYYEKSKGILRNAEIQLKPLLKSDIKSIISILNHIPLEAVPESLVDSLTNVSGGNPNFLKETLQMLIKSGIIEIDADKKACVLKSGFSDFAAVEGDNKMKYLVIQRLDQLVESLQDILKAGSIIGNCFPITLLSTLTPLNTRENPRLLEEMVENLVELNWLEVHTAEQIRRRGNLMASNSTALFYEFRNMFISSCIKETIPDTTLQKYHRKIARYYEMKFGDDMIDMFPVVANHYVEARDFDKAFKCYERASRVHFHTGNEEKGAAMLMKALSLAKEGKCVFDEYENFRTNQLVMWYMIAHDYCRRCNRDLEATMYYAEAMKLVNNRAALLQPERRGELLTVNLNANQVVRSNECCILM